MNNSRVEAFTDAVVAIIMTIMILEFKTPDSPAWTAILRQAPYLFAFAVSFLFIAVAWYNHHYMFTLLDHISKRIYWLNLAWLFSMSLIPVAAAWAGAFLTAWAPELFYWLVFLLWSLTYLALSHAIIHSLAKTNPANAKRVAAMPIYRFLRHGGLLVSIVISAALLVIYPPGCLILTCLELIYMAINTTPDSDQVA